MVDYVTLGLICFCAPISELVLLSMLSYMMWLTYGKMSCFELTLLTITVCLCVCAFGGLLILSNSVDAWVGITLSVVLCVALCVSICIARSKDRRSAHSFGKSLIKTEADMIPTLISRILNVYVE